jgi:HK97 family phage prohead protease
MTIGLTSPEVRTYAALELRAEQNAAGVWTSLTGRAVPYGAWANIGWYAEQWERGALSKSIDEAARALPLLMFHNSKTFPVGAASDWDDNKAGLDGKWELDDSEEAQRAAGLADKGFLTGMSIGFVPIRQSWDFVDDWDPDLGLEHMDKCTRQEARLVEVSLTPTPAYAGAVVDLVRSSGRLGHSRKSRASQEIAGWRAWVDSVRAGV